MPTIPEMRRSRRSEWGNTRQGKHCAPRTLMRSGIFPQVACACNAGSPGSDSTSLTDAIGIGALTRLVPRELVDEVVASMGRKEVCKNKPPARVMVYSGSWCIAGHGVFRDGHGVFYGDVYKEVMRKIAGGLDYIGTWRSE
jgi:hypothetical protein